MSLGEKEKYFVAVKVFLERGGEFFVSKDKYGSWDLPGGRIRKDEFDVPLDQVIKRKMSEELGDGIEYEIGKPVVLMRHERVEDAPGDPTIRIFAVGYEAVLLRGEPKLSDLFVESMWVDPKTFQPEKYFAGGWLKGVQDCLAVKNAR
jgi:8-oxo-dGTP pyrophosphatase MutT (NUDIX family)